MYPSLLSTSSTLSRSFELGLVTLPLLRICALRMRVNRSPIGSFTAIVRSSLPARLHQARDQPFRAKLPQRDARQFVLTIEATRPAGYLATITDTGCRRIARHLRKLQRSGETLFHRLGLVICNSLKSRTAAGIFLGHPAAPVVLFDR